VGQITGTAVVAGSREEEVAEVEVVAGETGTGIMLRNV
jgi:hypothetical protein